MDNAIVIYAIYSAAGILAFYVIKNWLRKRRLAFMEAYHKSVASQPQCLEDSSSDGYFFIDIRGRGCIEGFIKPDK